MSEKRSAVSWDELKDELFDEADKVEIDRLAKALHAQVRAYRLTEIRKRREATQVEVAHRMGVSQARVSDIERGRLTRAEVDTLAAYADALGGRLRIVADFGEETLILG